MRQSVHNNQCRVSQPPEQSPGLNRVKLQEFKSEERSRTYRTVIGQLHSCMLDFSLAVDISLALPYSGAVQILPERDPLEDGCIKMDPQPNCMAAPHPGIVGIPDEMKLRSWDECVLCGYGTSIR
ncbi:hypothetical protein NEUTE2DRAFT_133366 [Neurospora tetrasperma FGSC 2509]|nr:hypothetical protein NEUTE2DRAFT_133366 [Neurospora tetrasperma FGSC 2509]